MKSLYHGISGYVDVGKALERLLAAKTNDLRDLYGIETRITGVASRSLGWLVNSEGLPTIDSSQLRNNGTPAEGVSDWLRQVRPDVVFETTSLSHETGQPAIEYLAA